MDSRRIIITIYKQPLLGGVKSITLTQLFRRTLHSSAPTRMAAQISHDAPAGSVVVMEKVSLLR